LGKYDARFKTEGFWEMREGAMKVQHLITHGWIEWLAKGEWMKKRAGEMVRDATTV